MKASTRLRKSSLEQKLALFKQRLAKMEKKISIWFTQEA